MQISEKDLQEFMTLYEDEFGEKLSKDEVSEAAGNLAELYSLLAAPLPSEKRSITIPQSDPAVPASLS